jgi:hypothetical protein
MNFGTNGKSVILKMSIPFSIMALSITTFSAMPISTTTLGIMPISTTAIYTVTPKDEHKDTQKNGVQNTLG